MVEYLNLADVIDIHAEQLALHGGQDGIRDQGGIESAIAQPAANVFGQELHPELTDKAAAYLFHLSECQGFLDGNKRTATVACITFLAKNGYRVGCPDIEMYRTVMMLANKIMTKEDVAEWLRDRLEPIP